MKIELTEEQYKIVRDALISGHTLAITENNTNKFAAVVLPEIEAARQIMRAAHTAACANLLAPLTLKTFSEKAWLTRFFHYTPFQDE